ncbi:MAG: protein kinase, partial [Acidobacteria bacterium]|nr:protein kinase [Acidobacteriota bacterium]
RKEALALAKLNHPNIATVHEFGSSDGVDFLVTEYIPGISLNAKISGGPLPNQEILRLAAQLAEGLASAHQQGVIHCDLKPGNLLLMPDGRLKILDFGLAELLQLHGEKDLTASVTQSHEIRGTLPYMAPEQLRGEKASVRTDIWAMGAVLYEMSTGQRPFREQGTIPLAHAILYEAGKAPRALNPQLSPDLERIILKCLEKDPENRYQSAKEVAVDLRRVGHAPAKTSVLRSRLLLLAGMLVAIAAIAGFWLWHYRSPSASPQTGKIMLAVLPFENRNRDPAKDYFADGLTEEMIAQLGRVSPNHIGVIARASAMRYKNTSKSIGQIGHELGVSHILEGGTWQLDDRVRITAELIHVEDQTQLWSSGYERRLEDIFAVQNAVTLSIAQALAVELLPGMRESLSKASSVSPQAYEAYLRGRFHWSRLTGQELEMARQYFDEAIRMDPNYSAAYLGIADYYLSEYKLPPKLAVAKAREYVQKALTLDNSLPGAHRALAWIEHHEWAWSDAEQEFKLAVKLNPSDSETHRAYSILLSTLGRSNEARSEIHAAQEGDPLSMKINTSAGWAAYFARDYDRAIEQCQKALELEPDAANPHDCLGSAYIAKGMYPEAIRQCQAATTLSGEDPDRAVCLGRAYAAARQTAKARKVLHDLQAAAGQGHVPPYFLALLYAALGEADRAFASLEQSYQERDPYLAWIKVSPAVDPLRSDARLEEFLRRLRLSSP